MNEVSLFDSFQKMSKEEIQDFITHIESKMSEPQTQENLGIEIPLKHHFSKDVYAREIFIPKGTFLVGKIHKFENLNILSSGELSIISIEGCARVKAPFTVVSPAGVKRLAYAHEDSVWTTIHGTNEKDVEKIEDQFIAKSYEEILEFKNKKLIIEGV